MLFKNYEKKKKQTYKGNVATFRNLFVVSEENITIDKKGNVEHDYSYSVHHPDNIGGISTFNVLGQKVINNLTGYKEELTNS